MTDCLRHTPENYQGDKHQNSTRPRPSTSRSNSSIRLSPSQTSATLLSGRQLLYPYKVTSCGGEVVCAPHEWWYWMKRWSRHCYKLKMGPCPPAGGRQDCYIYSKRLAGEERGVRGGGRARHWIKVTTGSNRNTWHNVDKWVSGVGSSSMIICRANNSEERTGSRFTAEFCIPKLKTPQHSECLPSTVWHVKSKGWKGMESTKNQKTWRTFKTGSATQHWHVLVPTKISGYIEYYRGSDCTNRTREKQGGVSYVPETAASVALHRDPRTWTRRVTQSRRAL